MKPIRLLPSLLLPSLLLPALAFVLASATPALAQASDSQPPGDLVDMAAMMEKARQYTTPGEHHMILKRFLGTWDTTMRLTMPGLDAPPEKGVATFSWLMEGRWLQQTFEGAMFGQSAEIFMIVGYDNFKQSFVTMSVNSVDTAMTTSEGDMSPEGKALITYGTLDEYLTGEHDKMVKYVWRFHSDDWMTLEIHDLPIGEKNTQVLEFTYTRRRDS